MTKPENNKVNEKCLGASQGDVQTPCLTGGGRVGKCSLLDLWLLFFHFFLVFSPKPQASLGFCPANRKTSQSLSSKKSRIAGCLTQWEGQAGV